MSDATSLRWDLGVSSTLLLTDCPNSGKSHRLYLRTSSSLSPHSPSPQPELEGRRSFLWCGRLDVTAPPANRAENRQRRASLRSFSGGKRRPMRIMVDDTARSKRWKMPEGL
jgi:hypothetical protein